MSATLPSVDHVAGRQPRVRRRHAPAGAPDRRDRRARCPPPSSPPSSTWRPPGSVGTSASSRPPTRSPCTTAARGPQGRGRPARRYVVTSRGQAALSHRYSEIAAQALRFLAETAGPEAVEGFAERRVRDLEERHAAAVRRGRRRRRRPRPGARRRAVRRRVRRVGPPGPRRAAMQLCQGHCPVQDVAHEFPQLCEAEARAFSRLLGVHVQRLSTLAGGGHVCTTNIPVIPPHERPCPPRALRGRTISMSAQTDSTAAATPRRRHR